MSLPYRSGVLPVEKGRGVTSFEVVARLRRLLRVRRIGHGGTLDPGASGVLPILVGEATKLTPYLMELEKEYLATVRLGVVTDTQDLSGRVLETRRVPDLDEAAIRSALDRFVGVIAQVPPMYSALHHGGRRLYELARSGVEVERRPREVTVHAIRLTSIDLPSFTIHVSCGKGTYVRTLAADVGEALGCGATLSALIRTRVGPFGLDASVPWSELEACLDGSSLWARVLTSDSVLASLPAVRLEPDHDRAFLNGHRVPCGSGDDGLVRVYGPRHELLGLGLRGGSYVKPERLLHADTPRSPVLPG